MIRTLLIDNYDSFTFNLYHYLAEVNGTPPVVVPNDWTDWHPGALDGYDNVVISPGPGSPDKIADFGICAEVIETATIPILGICLGHQGIALAHGGSVAHAPSPRHGRLSEIRNFGVDLFTDLPPTFNAVRYHSLAVTDVPETLEVTAYSDDGVIMGLRHRTLPQWGVQFHPESISTEHSLQLLNNFARLTREWTGGASTEHDRTGADSTTSDQLIRSTRSVAPTGEKAITDEVSNLVALHVEVLDQSASSEQIFVSLYGHEEESVWLDGNRPGSPSSRFSIMAAPTGPNGRVATADANTGTIRIRHNGHLPSPTGQTQRPRAPSSIS